MHLCKHSTSSSTNTLQMTPQFTWEWCSAVERRAQSTNDTRRWCQEMLERLTWRHLCLSFTYKCNFMFLRPRQASSLIQSLRKQKNVTDARCSDLPSGDYDYFFLVIWSAGSVRNSWTRNWISLNTGANFSHQSLLYFWSKKRTRIHLCADNKPWKENYNQTRGRKEATAHPLQSNILVHEELIKYLKSKVASQCDHWWLEQGICLSDADSVFPSHSFSCPSSFSSQSLLLSGLLYVFILSVPFTSVMLNTHQPSIFFHLCILSFSAPPNSCQFTSRQSILT